MRITLQTYKNKILPLGFNCNKGTTTPFIQDNKRDTFELSFKASDRCSTQNFQVKNLPNLHCPACGLIMLTEEQVNAYVNDVASKKGQNLFNALEKYEDDSVITGKPSRNETLQGIYRPIKKEIIDIYKRLALEYPNRDLYALTILQAETCIHNLIEKQLKVVDELREYIESNFNEEEKKIIIEKLESYVEQIQGSEKDSEKFARKKFIYFMKMSSPVSHRANIEKIASKMPTSENDIDSFFVKYSDKASSSREIASKFVNQSTPTAEHIKPKSRGGKDSLSNYICDCADCNSKRSSTPFYDWLQTLPGFEERLQDYINDVRIAIDENKLPDEYDSYIDKVVDMLEDSSNGEVILTIPEVMNPKKHSQVMEKRKKELENFIQKNEKLKQKRTQLEAEIQELKKYPYFNDVQENQEINIAIERLDNETVSLTNQANELKRNICGLIPLLAELESKLGQKKYQSEKQALEQEFEQKKNEKESLESKLSECEKRLNVLKKRRINLKKQKKMFSARETFIRRRLIELRNTIKTIDASNEAIEKLNNAIKEEDDLAAKLMNIVREIETLEEINSLIAAQSSFATTNTSAFYEYSHQKDVLKIVDGILTNKEYKKISSNPGMAREAIEIAKKALEQTISELETKDEVRYYLNNVRLRALKDKQQHVQDKLNAINNQKIELETVKKVLDKACGVKTQEAIRNEHAAFEAEINIIDRIYSVAEKQGRLEYLQKAIKRNEIYLEKLKDYTNLTNAQYAQLKSFIDVEAAI